jgi:hypothetical protein
MPIAITAGVRSDRWLAVVRGNDCMMDGGAALLLCVDPSRWRVAHRGSSFEGASALLAVGPVAAATFRQ